MSLAVLLLAIQKATNVAVEKAADRSDTRGSELRCAVADQLIEQLECKLVQVLSCAARTEPVIALI